MSQTLLIVDDSASFRKLVAMQLSRQGYKVLEADNGEAGLQLLNGRSIHMIICDVNMPVMSGPDFVRAVRNKATYRTIPVAMLTTVKDSPIKDQMKLAGVKAWMVKPFQPSDLLTVVQKFALPDGQGLGT